MSQSLLLSHLHLSLTGSPANVKETVTATAKQHLKSQERLKLNRSGEVDPGTGKAMLGNKVIRGILAANVVLTPIPIDPHDNWGPMTEHSLPG